MVATADVRTLAAAVRRDLADQCSFGDMDSSLGNLVALVVLDRIQARYATLQDFLADLERLAPAARQPAR